MRVIFKKSKKYSIGVEIELQIVDRKNLKLISKATEVLRDIHNIKRHPGTIKPEISKSMIELNSGIHQNTSTLLGELTEIQNFLIAEGNKMKIKLSGGGVHPFQKWQDEEIYPAQRYKKIFETYNYLAKQDAVFGQHVHIGCATGTDAIYLTHILARYLPQLIALSASSPFYQGFETLFNSVRVGLANRYPTSGFIPFVKSWQEFNKYYTKMRELNIIKSMKDIYWDIRPKPEFGTVEIRILDTPLTIKKSVMLAAYIQTLAHYILEERTLSVLENIYTLYAYNRFQAARFGYEGYFINPFNGHRKTIQKDILATAKLLKDHASYLGNSVYLEQVVKCALTKTNDAKWIHKTYAKVKSLPKLMRAQSKLWMEN